MTEFLTVNGVGSKKAEQYGEAFIDCIRKWKVAENVWWGFKEDEWKAWLEEERMDRLKQKAMNERLALDE